MCSNRRERMRALKKAGKSLLVIAAFTFAGYFIGLNLGAYFAPALIPEVVNVVPQPDLGAPFIDFLAVGSFFGSIAGALLGTYVACLFWWQRVDER